MGQRTAQKKLAQPAEAWPGASTPGWDEIDEAGWESFPASDPPAPGSVQSRESAPAKEPPARPPQGTDPGRATPLTASERRTLLEALDDEYKAWATYDQVIADFGAERPFINIREAEARHIAALHALSRRYGVAIPVNSWRGRVPRFASPREACAAAAAAEVENAALLDRLIEGTERPDLRTVLSNLRRASQERHLPAFRRCAARGSGAGRHGWGGRAGHCRGCRGCQYQEQRK